ncbi:MAG TPA: hypothetical protein DCS93_43430 [Microscillaceae bacterium]|nr:hypothetical protein [Microscillaceae bacterium]
MIKFKGLIKSICLLVLLGLYSTGYSQKKMYLAYEFGVSLHGANFKNPQQNVEYKQDVPPIPAFVFTRQLHQSWYIETGIYQGALGVNMTKKGEFDSTSVQFAQEQVQVPLRVQSRVQVFDNHLHLFASLGANVVFSSGGYTFTFTTAKNTTETLNKKLKYRPTYVLGELGVGFDLFLGKRFFIGGRYRFNLGFANVLDIAVSTLTNGENSVEEYFLTSSGSFHAFMLSLGFRIGKLDKVKKI